jgi:TrmH family RNA methyltransferase
MIHKVESISSKQNPKIKNLLHLQKNSERNQQGVFIVEGIKEVEKAVKSGYEVDSLFFCPEIIDPYRVEEIFSSTFPKNILEVTRDVFNKVAYRENSGGIIILAKPKDHALNQLNIGKNPLILVIEGVEKPGNIGAIFRTADAAGISAIIICDQGTDLYNPNSIRASLGCVFAIPTAICTSTIAIEWLKAKGVKIFVSYLKAAVPYHKIDFTKPSAIVMGTEATGISKVWLEASDANIIIPMQGQADSMNVSTAAAVLIFEACRQRGFKVCKAYLEKW